MVAMLFWPWSSYLQLVQYTLPEGIFETPVGLDPDFQSQRTQTLDLTRVRGNSDFGSDQSPSFAHLLVQKNWDHRVPNELGSLWVKVRTMPPGLYIMLHLQWSSNIHWKHFRLIEVNQWFIDMWRKSPIGPGRSSIFYLKLPWCYSVKVRVKVEF